jgi:hypothetical protein
MNGGFAADSYALPLVSLYDADRNLVVSGVAMTKIQTGIYEYIYTVSTGATQGVWETMVAAEVQSGLTLSLNDYWEVRGSPAQVIINSISDNTIPSIAADVTITNEGAGGYEYLYEWCVVSQSNNACGGGDDVFYASAAKFIQPGENWNTTLTADVQEPGDYYFKLVVYFGTDSSGASRSFTAIVGGSPTPSPTPPQGPLGGGGVIQSPVPTTYKGADLNKDNKVNSIDFSILLYFWKTRAPFSNPCVDINADGKVDSVDFSILLYQWGSQGIPMQQ